jgi:hypothetical protein
MSIVEMANRCVLARLKREELDCLGKLKVKLLELIREAEDRKKKHRRTHFRVFESLLSKETPPCCKREDQLIAVFRGQLMDIEETLDKVVAELNKINNEIVTKWSNCGQCAVRVGRFAVPGY